MIHLPRNMLFTFVRQILGYFFAVIYGLLTTVLQIIFVVAGMDNSSTFTEVYEGIQTRAWGIIGIIMLFKVTFSLITYFANPDKIMVPNYVFPLLSRIQQPIVNTVGNIILDNASLTDATETGVNVWAQSAEVLMSVFIYKDSDCSVPADYADTEAKTVMDTIDVKMEMPCGTGDGVDKDRYAYTFDILSGIGSIGAILTLEIIIGIQVGVRTFKLFVLRLLAPVPIISCLDPKSTRSGGRTSQYISLFIRTYIDLFIHFGVLYFVLLLIRKIMSYFTPDSFSLLGDGAQLLKDSWGLGLIFLIIGLLIFAFQAPKFIKKALGLKDSEFGSGLAGLLTGTAAVAGGVGAGIASYKNRDKNAGFLSNFGSAAASAIRAGGATLAGAGATGSPTKAFAALGNNLKQQANERALGITGKDKLANFAKTMFTGTNDEIELTKQKEDMEKELKEQKERLASANVAQSRRKQLESTLSNHNKLCTEEAPKNPYSQSTITTPDGNQYIGSTKDFVDKRNADVAGKGFN